MGGPVKDRLERVAAWAHAKRHAYAEKDALGALSALTGDEFLAARERALDLAMCVDPGHCDHVS